MAGGRGRLVWRWPEVAVGKPIANNSIAKAQKRRAGPSREPHPLLFCLSSDLAMDCILAMASQRRRTLRFCLFDSRRNTAFQLRYLLL